jgi:hypothetical protein
VAQNKSGKGTTGIKNTGDFHPADEKELRLTREAPSGAVPTDMDAWDAPEDWFQHATDEELRERARALALGGADDASREELIGKLVRFKREVLDPRPRFESEGPRSPR